MLNTVDETKNTAYRRMSCKKTREDFGDSGESPSKRESVPTVGADIHSN